MNKDNLELDEDNTFAKEALVCEIGVKLKEAREAQNLSQDQVIKELKFNASFLVALEDGEWKQMPGEIYALGFLRQYAELLALDLSADIERIKTNSYELTTPLTYPDAPISPNRTWVVVAILIFILIIIVTNLFNSPQENHADTAVVSETPMIKQDNQQEVVIQVNTETDNASAAIEEDPIAETIAQHLSYDSPQVYTFKAISDDVWLQVFQETDGQEPKLRREALLRAGQSFTLESETTLLLTSGKPTALEILIDGQLVFKQGSLGEEEKVLKRFPLKSLKK
ncbi:MAG: helix-turn-helix domain-containing protein [Ghiorsea sp.]